MSLNNINILYVSHESGLNGAPRSLIEMLDCLKNYITPIVIIPRKGDLEELLVQRNIKYYIIPFMNGHGEIGCHTLKDSEIVYTDNIKAARTIAEIIKENHIQMIHSNSSVVDVGALAAVLSNKPHLWHLREFCEEDFGIEFLDKEWKKMLFSTSDFFSISQSIQNAYFEKYSLESDKAIDFIDAGIIRQNNSSFTRDKVTLIIAGYISQGKGQMDAIRAVNVLVKKNIHNIRLIVVGNGTQNYLWSIKKFIEYNNLENYVKLLPFSNNLQEIRNTCDISLTCSKMEGLGRVTMEAMLAGITVIGADTGGSRELIGDNQERGYLYEQGNFVNLADKIELVIKDKAQRDIKRKKAETYIRELTDSEFYAHKILDAYAKCINTFYRKSLYRERVTAYLKSNRVIEDEAISSPDIKPAETKPYKFKAMFYMAEKWLRIHHNGKTIGDYVRKHGYQSIALYGIGYLGRSLYDELYREHINISYIIDKAKYDIDEWIPLLKPEDTLPPVDLIIIAVAIGNEEIKDMLISKYPYHIVSFSNIIDEMLTEEEV